MTADAGQLDRAGNAIATFHRTTGVSGLPDFVSEWGRRLAYTTGIILSTRSRPLRRALEPAPTDHPARLRSAFVGTVGA